MINQFFKGYVSKKDEFVISSFNKETKEEYREIMGPDSQFRQYVKFDKDCKERTDKMKKETNNKINEKLNIDRGNFITELALELSLYWIKRITIATYDDISATGGKNIINATCWASRGVLNPVSLGYINKQSDAVRNKYKQGELNRIDRRSPLMKQLKCPNSDQELWESRYFDPVSFEPKGYPFMQCV